MSTTILTTPKKPDTMPEVQVTPAPKAPPAPRKSNAGRKTNADRARLKAEATSAAIAAEEEARKAARRAARDAKRAEPFDPLTKVWLVVALVIAAVSLATSFTVSYSMIVATSEWMMLPWPALAYIVPAFVELLTIFAALDFIISKSRGDSGWAPFWAMWVLSGVAVVGGAAHTISEWGAEFGPQRWESLVGTALAAVAPLVVIYLSKRISALVFVRPDQADS